MNRKQQQLALLVLLPLVVIGGFVLGRSLGGDDSPASGLQVDGAADATSFEHDYLIPPGTADRIA